MGEIGARINVAIVEDQTVLLESLMNCLSQEENIRVQLTSRNGQEFLDALESADIDVVLLDIVMPILDGWQTLKILSERYPNIRVVILSVHYAEEHILEAIKLGAHSYVHKFDSVQAVTKAIREVYLNGQYYNDRISRLLRKEVIYGNNSSSQFYRDPLTEREIQILQCICKGYTNKEISEQLHLSIRTVESHRNSLHRKTNCRRPAALVVFAIKNGYMDINSM